MECAVYNPRHMMIAAAFLAFAIIGLIVWWSFRRTDRDMETVYWPDGRKVHDPKRAAELRRMHMEAMLWKKGWEKWTARWDMNTPRFGNGRVYFQLDETGECIWEHIGTQPCWGPVK